MISGDYQTQFEDGPSSEEERDIRQKRAAGSNKIKRTKECPGCGAMLAISIRECRLCDYQFTSKSMAVSTQSTAQESEQIRERFPFEPERDEDGSLIIQAILNRRPRMSGRRLVKSSSTSAFAEHARNMCLHFTSCCCLPFLEFSCSFEHDRHGCEIRV